jgi:hypothetical protein
MSLVRDNFSSAQFIFNEDHFNATVSSSDGYSLLCFPLPLPITPAQPVLSPSRLSQHFLLKRRSPSTKLHNVLCQKTLIRKH